jgi:hypothetical protein
VECECPSGYELSEDESHCQDINECEIYGNGGDENDGDDSDDYYEEEKKNQPRATFCSHTCTNLIGKRHTVECEIIATKTLPNRKNVGNVVTPNSSVLFKSFTNSLLF